MLFYFLSLKLKVDVTKRVWGNANRTFGDPVQARDTPHQVPNRIKYANWPNGALTCALSKILRYLPVALAQ